VQYTAKSRSPSNEPRGTPTSSLVSIDLCVLTELDALLRPTVCYVQPHP